MMICPLPVPRFFFRQLPSLINQRTQVCPKFGFATLRCLEKETNLPNGGFIMVIYHGKKIKNHLKQIQGNGALSCFIIRFYENNTPQQTKNLIRDRNSMEFSCDNPTQRHRISTTESKPDDVHKNPGLLKPIFTKHFGYLKWRNPHLYKLYGYGLCK